MGRYLQKELVWINVAFPDFSGSKIRPAVIVSNDDYNKKQDDVIICAVTSRMDSKRYNILIKQEDIDKGKLPLDSMVRADKLMQVNKNMILKSFGMLKEDKFDLIVDSILELVKRK